MTESLSSFQYRAVSFPHLFTFRPNEGAAKNVGKNNLKSALLTIFNRYIRRGATQLQIKVITFHISCEQAAQI